MSFFFSFDIRTVQIIQNLKHLKQRTRIRPYANHIAPYKTYSNGWRMNFLEKFYIQQYKLQGPLMNE
jgi:hypothetical protein